MLRLLLSLTALVSAASLAAAAGPYQAPIQGPVQAPVKGAVVVAYELPVCCDRLIDYKHLRPRLEPCGPRYETDLLVKDLCACCFVQVPVCLPACCTGEPQVRHKGKHVVEYTWCSGYKVRIIVLRNGRVFVHYNA